jgi:rSAM/selenodomain-associated transferase 1
MLPSVRTVLLMAKAPRPGLSKTRLARGAGMTAARASQLAEAFLRDTLRTLRALRGARLVVCYAPADAVEELRVLAPGARLVPQPETDLGGRLTHAFALAFAEGARRVLALGADAPQLAPELLERAFAALDERELVLGPSLDGGYYLIGLREPRPALFEGVEWSTPRVRAQTLARARAGGLRVHELEPHFDVDEPADLEKLRAFIARHGAGRCPHTARALLEDG